MARILSFRCRGQRRSTDAERLDTLQTVSAPYARRVGGYKVFTAANLLGIDGRSVDSARSGNGRPSDDEVDYGIYRL